MRKKPYDYLDQRKMDFDSDFDEFKRAIQELHVSCYAGTLYNVSHNNDEPKTDDQTMCILLYVSSYDVIALDFGHNDKPNGTM